MFRYIVALLLLAPPAFGETYSWEDKQGVMHFTDSPENVPSNKTTKVTKRKDIEKPKPEPDYNSSEAILKRIRARKPAVLKVGMSLNDVIDELGMYKNVNTSEGAYGSRKQYIFDNTGTWYVYITNGKVTSWQTSSIW